MTHKSQRPILIKDPMIYDIREVLFIAFSSLYGVALLLFIKDVIPVTPHRVCASKRLGPTPSPKEPVVPICL